MLIYWVTINWFSDTCFHLQSNINVLQEMSSSCSLIYLNIHCPSHGLWLSESSVCISVLGPNVVNSTHCRSSGGGYEVLIIFFYFASIPVYFQLLRGVTFEVLFLSSYVLSSTMLPLLETFFELLVWNSIQCHQHTFFGCLQYHAFFIPVLQTLFF